MTTLPERLKRLRLAKGLTQAQLAKLVKTTQPSIQQIESGFSKGGRIIEKLADALNVSAAWLKFGEPAGAEDLPSECDKSKSPPVRYLPVLDWVCAGHGTALLSSAPCEETEYVPYMRSKCSENSYILIIKGDSMESSRPGRKTFLSGEKIVVTPSAMPSSGDYVIAIINDDEEAVFKQYIKDGPNTYLKPLNIQYPTIPINDKIKIIGVVTGHIDDNFSTPKN